MSRMKLGRPAGVSLVLIGAAAVSGCGETPSHEVPEPLERPVYTALADCREDWGEEDACEPFQPDALDGAGTGAGGSALSGTGGGVTGTHWYGPYYSRNGWVYDYDGRKRMLRQMPSRMATNVSQSLSPAQVYATGGRYVSTPAHVTSGSAKVAGAKAAASGGAVSRGGFGGSHASSGG